MSSRKLEKGKDWNLKGEIVWEKRIDSPLKAVQAAIVAEHRARAGR